jgi:hypothetical protein
MDHSQSPHRKTPIATLRVRIGQWFEANATGWGVVVVPLLVALLLGCALAGRLLT